MIKYTKEDGLWKAQYTNNSLLWGKGETKEEALKYLYEAVDDRQRLEEEAASFSDYYEDTYGY